MDPFDPSVSLLDEDKRIPQKQEESPAVQDRLAWRVLHASCFLLGGTTFIAGTACLLVSPTSVSMALSSATLYIIGSCGFLAVDVLEFFTFTSPHSLRLNIASSAVGSSLYVAGSVGFVPLPSTASSAAVAALGNVGAWGFVLGSAVLAVSEAAKCARIISDGSALTPAVLSALCVELGAGLGALSFLVGTGLYMRGQFAGLTSAVLLIWMIGSIFFTAGGVALAHRHFVLHLS